MSAIIFIHKHTTICPAGTFVTEYSDSTANYPLDTYEGEYEHSEIQLRYLERLLEAGAPVNEAKEIARGIILAQAMGLEISAEKIIERIASGAESIRRYHNYVGPLRAKGLAL